VPISAIRKKILHDNFIASKNSLAFELDSSSAQDYLITTNHTILNLDAKPNSSLHDNETINKVANIAKRAGVINSIDDIESFHANPAPGGKLGAKLQVKI